MDSEVDEEKGEPTPVADNIIIGKRPWKEGGEKRKKTLPLTSLLRVTTRLMMHPHIQNAHRYRPLPDMKPEYLQAHDTRQLVGTGCWLLRTKTLYCIFIDPYPKAVDTQVTSRCLG